MSPESEKYIKEAVERKRADLVDTINDIHSTLTNISSLSKPRIPEEIFLKELLPFACGELDSPEARNEFRNRYLNLFGGLNIPVDVIGKRGELLFTIPPIVTTEFLTMIRGDDSVSFAEIVRYGALLGTRTSHAQTNHLVSSLGQKGDEIARQQQMFGSKLGFDAWVDIFKRYNKKDALARILSTNSQQGNNAPPASTSGDDLDYDFEDDN